MLKSALRKQVLQQRKNLSEEEITSLNKKLLAQFKKLDLSNIKTLHIFLSIIHQKEPDTFLLIEWLQKNHPEIQIIVPKADFNSSLMSHYHYSDKNDLRNNHYHIPEPQQAKPFNGIPDMVIVPLLAFDERGYRVGYGKGFYDRFLQNISTQKIGLSFFDAVTEINDVHLNDIRLDKCITPNKITEFN
ncbi:5-formyltetrahydrofolate cyclo-ligase [Pedobacter sp. UC225_61]|uniref:5-formyltetrahydrofolate cyclo-ligase n=1 Tax=Pedobacter sp. UC225_61 TaxID=3374623 RepID=UPI0037A5EDA2